MRKLALLIGFSLSLAIPGPAFARQGDLDSLELSSAAESAVTLDRLWGDMAIQADSLWTELAPEVEKQQAEYFAPTGPADARWAERGVDMEALLSRAPGGAGANILHADDAEGPVIYVHDGAALAQLSSGWRPVVSQDFARSEGPAFISLLAVTPVHLLVSKEAWTRVGNGYCPTSATPAPADQMVLYRDARAAFDVDSDGDAQTEGAAFSIWTAVSRAETPRVCWIYVEIAPGVYESRSFDVEGRPLGNMDKGTKELRIVPIADLRAMLTAKTQSLSARAP